MKTRKILSALLALCFLISGVSALAENPLAFEKYDEPVTITRAQITTALSQWENGDTVTDNPWTRLVKDTLNINLVDDWQADSAQYDSKLNVAIGADNLPDVFQATSTQLAQLVEADMLYDMSEVYEKYASDDVRMLEDSDPDGFESGVFDGKLYGISQQHFGLIAEVKYMWIRQDWLDNLGLEVPTTVAELEQVCEAFVHDDPDQNGLDDTYAIGFENSLGNSFKTFAEMYHARPTIWYENEEGSLVYGFVQPEMRDALEAARDMVKKGYISPEFTVMDTWAMFADAISGKVGILFGASSWMYSLGIDLVNNLGEKAVFKAYALPSIDGETVLHPIPFPVSNYICVNRNCKNPEAVIKVLNAFTDIQLNAEGETYDAFINNERSWGREPIQVLNTMDDYNQGKYIPIAMETGDTSVLNLAALSKYERCMDWANTKNPDSVGYYYQVSGEGAYRIGVQVIDDHEYSYDAYHGVATPTMAAKQSSLEAMLAEGYTKIIMGEDISNFDTLVEQWGILGGNDITSEMNETKK